MIWQSRSERCYSLKWTVSSIFESGHIGCCKKGFCQSNKKKKKKEEKKTEKKKNASVGRLCIHTSVCLQLLL